MNFSTEVRQLSRQLHSACYLGDLETVDNVLSATENNEIVVNIGHEAWTPLHIATQRNNVSLVKLLLAKGAFPEPVDRDGETPLHIASLHGYTEIVQILLERGVYTLRSSSRGETALFMAIRNDQREVVDALLRHGIEESTEDYRRLYYRLCKAIIDKDLELARKILADTEDPDFLLTNAEPPLYLAAYLNRPEILEHLLQKNADVNLRRGGSEFGAGNTALHAAAARNHLKCVELLLKHEGAKIDVLNDEKNTALHIAAGKGHTEIVALLLRKGAKPNLQNPVGQTPLHCASSQNNVKTLELLLQYGADPDVQNNFRQTALHLAARRNDTGMLELLLLEHGVVDVNGKDRRGNTPLHWLFDNVLFYKDVIYENFLLLLRCGADPSLRNNDGRAPLLPSDYQSDEKHQALREHFEKLKFLEDYKNRKDGSLMGHKSTNSPYKKELEDLEDIVISWNPRTTLLDVLFMKRARMLRYAKNETLGELYRENGRDFERTFIHYGWLLNLQYRRGQLRAGLMDSAKKSLCYVLGTCIVDNCSEKVFKYFSDSKLKTLSLDNFLDSYN